jgi:hypothetical protein
MPILDWLHKAQALKAASACCGSDYLPGMVSR